MAISSGLFGHAGDATSQWGDAQRQEELIGNDIDDTVNQYILGEDENLEPTKPEYFTYEFDEETKTATLTGVKRIYKILGQYDAVMGYVR